jgi:hypothetical protein
MRLNETNRRRALKRRRKLMPEPRRLSTNQALPIDTAVLREVPAGRIRVNADASLKPVEQPATDTHVIQPELA